MTTSSSSRSRSRTPRPAALGGVAAAVLAGMAVLVATPLGAGAGPAQTSDTSTTTAPADPNATTSTTSSTTTTTTLPVLPPPILSAPVVVDPGAVLTDGVDEAGLVVGPSDALGAVELTSERLDAATTARDALADELAAVSDELVAIETELTTLGGGSDAITALSQRSLDRVVKLTRIRDDARDDARAVALRRYTVDDGTTLGGTGANLSSEALMEQSHRRFIATEARRVVIDRFTRSQDELDASIVRAAGLGERIDAVEAREAELRRSLATGVRRRDRASGALDAARREVRAARTNAVVVGSDLPLVALDAYWRATIRLAAERPRCGLEWPLLAAIGRSESNHGRFGGSEVDAGGRLNLPIAGIPLDGTNGTRRVEDTEAGLLDGDPNLDRAIGAMQFIPGTWRRWARDGSGDDIADPQNLYDAALSAGVYLCNSGPLDTDDGKRRAVFSYNRSDDYVELVLRRRAAYAALPVPSPPAG